jgi:flavodoxin
MKYAVIYDSETGNTEKIAEQIYAAIDSSDKEFINLKTETQIPEADLYFVGFPIHKKSCSMKVMEALEQIENGKIALFATCGMKPTEKYKQKLEDSLSIWVSDDAEYLGMFLCQGKTTQEQKDYFYNTNPEYKAQIKEMLEEGNHHPDGDDFEEAVLFAKNILECCS